MKKILKNNKIEFKLSCLLLSIILSSFFLFGKAISNTGTIDILFKSFKSIAEFTFLFIILMLIIYIAIFYLFVLIDNYKPKTKSGNKIYEFIFNKHPILIPFLIILLCGLPYIIYFYPGSVQWDGMKELNYYFGVEEWSNHHPFFPTFIMGLCVNLGRILINDNFGVFIFTFTQFLFSSFVFAYLIKFIKELKAPRLLVTFSLIFFSLVTMWPINAYTLVKDTYFYLFFILFVIEMMKMYLKKDNILKIKDYIPLFIFSVLLTLFRNNGIFIVVVTLILLMFVNKNYYRTISCVLLITGVVLINLLINAVLLPALEIEQTNIREALSVPIQQIGRYLREYPNDLTSQEKEILERIFPVGIEQIAERYNPEISDPIKFSLEIKDDKDLKDFFSVWGKLLIRHPKVYVDSFLENYYGYVYPPKREYKDGLGWYTIVSSKRVNKGFFDLKMIKRFSPQRKEIEKFAYSLRGIPIVGLLYSCGFYTWILIIGAGYLIKNKNLKALVPVVPMIVTVLFCFISPVNSYIRYIQPVMVVTPLFIAYILIANKKLKN